ncbi:MAG: hypothetical protein H7Z13_21265 [Ferruginibacter sp.]|nr:hypothetical protein [Ferruginibacter sp.]
MKKVHILLALLVAASFSSCKKDTKPATPAYTCTTCKTAPDALVANNTSSKGIYKGVVIGSSGTVMFDIANNGTTITALMVIDGITVNLSSAVTWVAGQPYIANFTGLLNGSAVSVNFSVGLGGGAPTVTSSSIPGHPNSTFNIVKETSTNLIQCFEGAYSTTLPETGTFNMIILKTTGIWGGIHRKTGSTTTGNMDGTISNNQLFGTGQAGTIGTVTADQISGSFLDGNNKTVTITAKRTL